MKKVIKFLRPFIIFALRLGWYITRPKTRGVKTILINSNEVLLVKNTYGYKWVLPGGGVKRNEEPRDAAKREVFEEVGIKVEEINPIETFTTFEEYKEDTVSSFYTEVNSKDFNIQNLEIDEAKWFPLNNLPEMGPVSKRMLDTYMDKYSIVDINP